MSRFRKLSHTIWHCQYHIVWVPKYRYKILTGSVGEEIRNCVRGFAEQMKTEVVELNVQPDHVHLLAMVPPKILLRQTTGGCNFSKSGGRVLLKI
jgi:putative transposase